MRTTTETTKKKLVKKFHTLLSKYSIGNDGKMAMLWAYSATSSLDLTIDQLATLCDTIEKGNAVKDKAQAQLDTQRKRLIASIFAWRASLGAPADMNLVKAIACRAAEVPEGYSLANRFNSISADKLRSLYNAFSHMAKDMGKVRNLTQEMIDKLTTLN